MNHTHVNKVLHFTSVHSASDVRIFHKESKTLHRADYTVVLVAPDQCDAQIVEGIRIKMVAVPNSRFYRFTCTAWQIYRVAWAENADIYHLHDPELLPIGFLLRLRGKKVIYDVHEDLPKSIQTKYWIPPVLRSLVARAASALEWASAQAFSGIVAATPSIAKRFPDKKTVTVQNFPILGELAQEDDLLPYNERPNHIVYMGGITQRRGAIQMVEAMALLPQHLSARLVLAGSFRPPDLNRELKLLPGWQAVDFLGWISRQEIREVFQDTRIGFVLFHPAPNHIEAQPNKLFEFMSAGIPVVASDFPLWREMIERVGCGLVVDPLDSQAIADAVQWLFEHPEEAEAMGCRGKKAVETFYNWEIESRKLVNFYEVLFQ
jgi:glycosyltransferase involved in cell wall biosynthesis